MGPTTRAFVRWAADSGVTGLAVLAAAIPISGQSSEVGDTFLQPIPGTFVTFEMTFVPGGSFQLGSPVDEAGRDADEGPQRTVRMDPFWMGVTEVSQEVFAFFRERRLDTSVGATPETPFDADAVTRPSPPYEDPSQGMGGAGHPATGMTRLSALHFARWLSHKTGRLYRLPTEAEWEYACRAGGQGAYGLGDDDTEVGHYAWFARNSGGVFHEVGSRAPNAWGIHDLHGNVAEWTLDPYEADFYAAIADDGSAANPSTGPSSRGRGVVRGGAFDDDVAGLRCADRFEETPAWKRGDPQIPKSRWWNTDAPHVGLRVVSPATEHSQEEIRAYWEAMLGGR